MQGCENKRGGYTGYVSFSVSRPFGAALCAWLPVFFNLPHPPHAHTAHHAHSHHRVRPEQVELCRRDYWANGGWETFLSYEDTASDILVGLLRLRKCGAATFRGELRGSAASGTPWRNASIVRELHVYGTAVPVHCRDPGLFQHQVRSFLLHLSLSLLCLSIITNSHHPSSPFQGFGTLLMEEAQRIARDEHGADVLAVISGVGTRGYYAKLGFSLKKGDALMCKDLT